jgi:hypothetical protein
MSFILSFFRDSLSHYMVPSFRQSSVHYWTIFKNNYRLPGTRA